MNTILSKRFFSANVAEIVVEAPLIARSRKAGHFVIVRVDSRSERMPLTIADADPVRGSITLVVQRIGVSSAKLCALEPGDQLHDVAGPLGRATDIRRFGTVLCACGGVGAAPMLPIARALKEAGNRVVTVLAARNKDLIILRDELAACSDRLIVFTDDGSLGQQGVVTQGVEQVLQEEKTDKCITIGPAVMMKFVALTTARYHVPTDASLNTVMVDGTGMCGACRVSVGGRTRFVCVDGPEFDAHGVDWDEMLGRMRSYKTEESAAYERYEQSLRPLTAKERSAISRVKMPELAPETRIRSLRAEVNQGLTPEQARTEAQRCLHCKTPTCVEGCPVNIRIPDFIRQVELGDIAAAASVIEESSSLPAVCGRVCPQEKQCEARCIHLRMGHEPVAIGWLERFVADHAPSRPAASMPPEDAPKVAVAGSGPAGLAFAGDMAKAGYRVTVFEALHETGGVLRYGIPEFRLPNRILDRETDGLKALGVTFRTDIVIGRTLTPDDLRNEGFQALFIASGAGLPRFMNIPGENLNGVMSCNEYLTRVNLMDAADPQSDTPLLRGRNVLVIGGGNTAMDAVRTARRLGAETATIVYRRTEEDMPARAEEVRHAREEGIRFLTLHNPVEYHADSNGRVAEAVLQVMQQGEPDESGRRSPVPVEGKTVTVPADLVIVAVGVSPNPLIPSSVEGLAVSPKGTIVADEATLQTSLPCVYAGGDIVRGGATVILAMADGRKAAAAVQKMLNKQQTIKK